MEYINAPKGKWDQGTPFPLGAFLLFSGSPETVKELNDIPKYLGTHAKRNRGNEMPDIACDAYIPYIYRHKANK